MIANFICLACGKEKEASPRTAGRQSYCGDKFCQRARKAAWQRQILARDADHRVSQRQSQESWRRKSPGYWARYRQANPEKAKRNRVLQRQRNQKRRVLADKASEPLIAKMDALLSGDFSELPGAVECWLVPVIIAKMDAFRVKIVRTPEHCP